MDVLCIDKSKIGVDRMYIEILKRKHGSKIYHISLLRESYRENGKVKKKTLLNLKDIPMEQVLALKASLQKEKGRKQTLEFEISNSREYGASFALRELAKNIGLDRIISSTKSQWRENVLAMITGRITYQGSKLNLVNTYMDSALWELAGHKFGVRPDVNKDCYDAMDELQKRKTRIEKKLVKKHLKNGAIILYDMTNTWLEGEYYNSEISKYGKPKGGKRGYKQVAIGLLTNSKGCPVAVEVFKGNTSDQMTVLDQIKKLSNKYGIKQAIFVGDRGMLTQKRINEIDSNYFKTITALTHIELKAILKKENIQLDLFDEMNITEIMDSENKEVRYILCKNEKQKIKERETREALIQKVEKLLIKKAAVKKKRKQQKVCASIGRIFEKNKVEKFFSWNVDEDGRLTWSRKDDIIEKEKEIDGCYVIKTNSDKTLSKEEIVLAYRGLQKVEQAFRNMKTIVLELRPIHHKFDERIKTHIFIVMLSYYLQWHMTQKLKTLFEENKNGSNRRWTINVIINRLKSIVKYNKTFKGIVVGQGVSKPDVEQERILELLGVKM